MRAQTLISVLRPMIRRGTDLLSSSSFLETVAPRSSRFFSAMAAETNGKNLGWTPVEDGKYDYDLITIGIGSGGTRASRIAASFGAKVRLIYNLIYSAPPELQT